MTVWDVTARPAHEQFGYWREVICEAFVPLAAARGEDVGHFRSRVETRPLRDVVRARLASQPQETSHGAREVARTDDAYLFVNLQTAGRCGVEQAGRHCVVRPGQFTIVDTAEPYWFDLPEPWRIVSYRIPHRLLEGRLGDVREHVGQSWDARGAGGAVIALMSAFWELDAATGPAVVAELEQSLAAAVSAAAAERSGAAAQPRAALRAAVLRHVEQRLGDPSLTVTSACRHLGVSPRTLHAAVSAGGETFAALVRRRRLDRAAALLADRSSGRTVTEIASAVGFDDPSSFSRAFRREYGVAPTAVRAGARSARIRRTD